MQTVNWYSGKSKKPFASFDIPNRQADFIERRAKREGISVEKFLSDGLSSTQRARNFVLEKAAEAKRLGVPLHDLIPVH